MPALAPAETTQPGTSTLVPEVPSEYAAFAPAPAEFTTPTPLPNPPVRVPPARVAVTAPAVPGLSDTSKPALTIDSALKSNRRSTPSIGRHAAPATCAAGTPGHTRRRSDRFMPMSFGRDAAKISHRAAGVQASRLA